MVSMLTKVPPSVGRTELKERESKSASSRLIDSSFSSKTLSLLSFRRLTQSDLEELPHLDQCHETVVRRSAFCLSNEKERKESQGESSKRQLIGNAPRAAEMV